MMTHGSGFDVGVRADWGGSEPVWPTLPGSAQDLHVDSCQKRIWSTGTRVQVRILNAKILATRRTTCALQRLGRNFGSATERQWDDPMPGAQTHPG